MWIFVYLASDLDSKGRISCFFTLRVTIKLETVDYSSGKESNTLIQIDSNDVIIRKTKDF